MGSESSRSKYRVACLYLYTSSQKQPNDLAKDLHALAEACYRFSPQLAVRESAPGDDPAIFLEIGGCERLYSEQLLEMKLSRLAGRFGWLARVTFGDSAGEAFALAKNSSYFYLQDLPLESLLDYLNPFKKDPDSEVALLKTVGILKTLGLKNVGEFATLPPRTLASRFGQEAVELSARVRRQLETAWPGFRPSPIVSEKMPVGNSESLEALGFVIKALIDRLVARMYGRCERASRIQIDFDLVKWGKRLDESRSFKREFKLELPLAQGSSRGLFPIVQEYLAQSLQREPITSPIDSIEIRILDSVPSRGAQKDFFSRKEEESELWDALVARLSLKIGAGKVYTAVPVKRYLPERAYQRSLEKRPVSEYRSPRWPHRPTRLLKYPQPITWDPGWEVLEGPERISGEWWNSQYEGFFRDYYQVQTVRGEQLWVFVNRKSLPKPGAEPSFYLHGIPSA